jgi:type I restriction enzyme S subunit
MQLVRLGDVAQINPRFDKSSLADDTLVSFVPMAAVGAADGKIDTSTARPFVEVKKGSYTPFRDGDVLFAKVTPCMENGKMAVARDLKNGVGFGSSEFHVLRPSQELDAKYLYYFVSSQSFRKEAAGHMTGAVGLRRVPAAFLADAQLPLVPLEEQRNIVSEIEKQFSRLDEAVANLQRVKANLKRYKASVLKAAVEGRLVETEASIAQREGRSYETGEQLLQRILEERRAKWTGRGKYKEPDVPDPMPVLPKGWTWATLDTVCSKITDGTHHSPVSFPSGEFKYVTSKNVREFRLDLSDISYVPAEVHEEIYARCDVRYRDVLYVKDGANTGLAAVNTLIEPFSLLSSVGVFRPLEVVDSAYMVAYLNCSHVRDEMLANIAGVAITRLTLSKLKVSRIAVPPRAEQTRIVAEVDRHLSIIREVEAEVDANLQRAQALRQSTLSKAFT